MAWTTPRTWVTSEVVTAANMNTHVRDNEVYLREFHGARVYQAGALSTADNVFQLVTWDTTDYDSNSFAVLGSEWFVVPSNFAGYYRVTASAEFASNASGLRRARLLKNETYSTRTPNGVGTSLSNTLINPVGAGVKTCAVTWTGPLVVGDHITLEGNQNSGGSLSYDPGSDTLWMEIHYLGN